MITMGIFSNDLIILLMRNVGNLLLGLQVLTATLLYLATLTVFMFTIIIKYKCWEGNWFYSLLKETKLMGRNRC